MNIEKVIISSDNSHYKDFYIPVKRVWNYFNIDVLHIEISDNIEKEIIQNDNYVIPAIKDIKTSLQAQVSRIYAIKKYPNCNILISDIDMIPINIRYFKDNARKLLDNQILFYSGQPYGNNLFPMCYILGNSNILNNFFELDLYSTFNDFIIHIIEKYTGDWASDERYVYDCYLNYKNKENCIINENRKFQDRIDRTHRGYNVNKLYSGYYKDSHLLRPYNKYKLEIEKLINYIIKIPERIIMVGPWQGEDKYELQWIEFIKHNLKKITYDKLVIGCRPGNEYKYVELNAEKFLNIDISGIKKNNLINDKIPRFQIDHNNSNNSNNSNNNKKIIQINPENNYFNIFKNYKLLTGK